MTALRVGAGGSRGPYLYCPECCLRVHAWADWTTVTVPQIIVAEQRHLADVHPQPVPDYDALHDGYYGTGGE